MRVTFGRSPKSDQKDCLKPAVSRLPPRPAHRPHRPAHHADAARHPKCGIDLRLSPLPLDLQNVGVCRPTVLAIIKSRTCRYRRQVSVRLGEPQNTKEADHGAFQTKSGSAQRNTLIHISDGSECTGQRRKEIQKPLVFGGILSPISFAAERNGAVGDGTFP